jgi:outer membrane protein TolC
MTIKRQSLLRLFAAAAILSSSGVLTPPDLLAQQTVALSAESLFRLIDDNSRTLKLRALQLDEAEEGESVARNARLPQLNASLYVGYLGNGYVTDRNFSNGMAVTNPHSHDNFALEAMQVIYSGGAVTSGIKLAELNRRMASLNLDKSRQEVRFMMLGWAIDLHCLKGQQRVIDENIRLAEEVLDDMKARRDEGIVLDNDITRYELQLATLQLQKDKVDERVRTTNYRLANALDLPADTEFDPQLELADEASLTTEPAAHWQALATTSNISLKQASLGIDMSEEARKLAGADKKPKLSLYAYGRFDSPIVTEVPVLDKNMLYWGFGLNVSYNISSLYTTNKQVRKARLAVLESRQAQELAHEQVRTDVESAWESLQTSATEVRTQRKSVELARQNYSVTDDRFADGMVLVTDMVDAANVRLASEIGLENARAMLLFNYYKLKFTTNTLF